MEQQHDGKACLKRKYRRIGACLVLAALAAAIWPVPVCAGEAQDDEGGGIAGPERESGEGPEARRRPPRWSVGVFALAKTTPYRDADARLMVLPSLSYAGRWVQVYGPMVRVKLVETEAFGLHATVQYRFDGYGARGGTPLAELDDPRDTVEAGLAFNASPHGGWVWRTAVAHDVLGRHNGWRGTAGVSHPWRKGPFFVAPEIGLTVLSPEITRYYYGVSGEQATERLSAYAPGSAVVLQAGLMAGAPVSRNWMLSARVGVERLDEDLYRSPIVEDRWVWTSFVTLSRGFL